MAYVMRKTPRSSFMHGMHGMGAAPAPPDESPPILPPDAKPPVASMPPVLAPPPVTAPRVPPILLWGGGALLAYWLLFKE